MLICEMGITKPPYRTSLKVNSIPTVYSTWHGAWCKVSPQEVLSVVTVIPVTSRVVNMHSLEVSKWSSYLKHCLISSISLRPTFLCSVKMKRTTKNAW